MNAMMALIIAIFMQSAQIRTEVFLVPAMMVLLEMMLQAEVLTLGDTAVRSRQSFKTIKIMLSRRHFFNFCSCIITCGQCVDTKKLFNKTNKSFLITNALRVAITLNERL